MIASLTEYLSSRNIDVTAEDVADIIWLAAHLPLAGGTPVGEAQIARPPVNATGLPKNSNKTSGAGLPETGSGKESSSSADSGKNTADQTAPVYESSAPGSLPGRLPLKIPAAPSLPNARELARELRPLKRRVPSKIGTILDEEATVDLVAGYQGRIWMPVFRPATERWLEIALVIDEGESMRIWRQTADEFRRLLECQGAFRDVRTWRMATDSKDGQVSFFSDGSSIARSPQEIIDPAGRRLVIVVTDCISPAWSGVGLPQILAAWGRHQPVALLQMLPQTLWAGTVMAQAKWLRVHSRLPGLANGRLDKEIKSHWRQTSMEGVPIPVLTLERAPVGGWVRLLTALGDAWAPALLFDETGAPAAGRQLPEIDNFSPGLTAPERLRNFEANASPVALSLAKLFAAAAPLSLPVMRLIQRSFLPQSKQLHLAEVFLGGLLARRVSGDPETIQYDFREGVRDRLLDAAIITDSFRVLITVSEYLNERFGQTLDFQALLSDPEKTVDIPPAGHAKPFALIAAKVLSRMGGRYRQLAGRLDPGLYALPMDSVPIENAGGKSPIMLTETYEAQITVEGEMHLIKLSGGSSSPRIFPAELGHRAALSVNGRSTTLGALADRFLHYDETDSEEFFGERGQLDIGRYLFQQLFKGISRPKQNDLSHRAIDLQIITDDEEILRLPWTLIYAGQNFLTAAGWSISFGSLGAERIDVELPPSPKILIAMPQPIDRGPTAAQQHLADLEGRLSQANRLHVQGQHLRVVRSWDEFKSEVMEFKPHIVYYYGHGEDDRENSRMVFEDRNHQPEFISAAEFANSLRRHGQNTPLITYLNCCYGDAGGLLGIGKQIGEVIPAVVTNNTVIAVEAAQQQALEIWEQILLAGKPPHAALTVMQQRLAGQIGGFADIRWTMPALHRRYQNWSFKPPQIIEDAGEPEWAYTLDRRNQASVVLYEMDNILQTDKQKALTFLWYGLRGDGVKPFYNRIEKVLERHLKDVRIYPVDIELPLAFYDFHADAGEKFAEGFDVRNFDEVADKIRIEARRRGGRQTIVYLRHPVIRPRMELFNLSKLETYLKWIHQRFVKSLGEHIFSLIGLAYEVEEPDIFHKAVENLIEQLELDDMPVMLLDRLPLIGRRDLSDFLRDNKLHFDPETQNKIINQILEVSGGQYENVIEELRILLEKGSRAFLESERG